MSKYLSCAFHNVPAAYMAPQSDDEGTTITYVPVCADDLPTWFEKGEKWGEIVAIAQSVDV